MFSQLLTLDNALIALAWAAYGALHSALAWPAVKRRIERYWPSRLGSYRLAYNGLAVALLIPLLFVTEVADDRWLWRWQGHWAWLAHATTVAVLVGFFASSRAYDMRDFLGLRIAAAAHPPRFGLSPLHRCVRHPWYFLGLIWLWTRDMDAARLSAALVISVYIWLGSRLEDHKLERELGAAYRDYRARVPGLLPRPWRCLSRAEVRRLRN